MTYPQYLIKYCAKQAENIQVTNQSQTTIDPGYPAVLVAARNLIMGN
jgi:hypothetical protein